MRRTKYKSDFQAKCKAWLTTASHLGYHFPYCDILIHEFVDFWGVGDFTNVELVKELKTIQEIIADTVIEAIDKMEAEAVVDAVTRIDTRAINHLRQILPFDYSNFFETPHGQFPAELSDAMPFVSKQKQTGRLKRTKGKAIIKKQANQEIRMWGELPEPTDIKTIVALNQIRKRSHVAIWKQSLHWKTSFVELAIEMGKKQPDKPSTRRGIKNSLGRMRSATIEIEKPYYLGGFIDTICDLEEDSAFRIDIFQNKYFVERFQKQYNGIPDYLLPEWYQLPPKAACLYSWLLFRPHCNLGKWWLSKKHGADLIEVYDLAGLSNPDVQLPRRKIRSYMKEYLTLLEGRQFLYVKYEEDDHFGVKRY